MTLALILIFTVTFVTVVALVPVFRRLAFHFGVLDVPNERKLHTEPVPYLGGMAIFLGICAGIITGFVWQGQNFFGPFWGLAAGSLIIVALGLYDDFKGTGARGKLLFQTMAALLVYFSGIQLKLIALPVIGGWETGWLSLPLTVFWILAITNAINLLDGLDGLASGVTFIATSFMGFFAFQGGQIAEALIFAAINGSLAGFLVFNFPPARIFMGDTGSLLLGFLMATLTLNGLQKGPYAITILIPIVLLTVPISDTLLSIIRRARSRSGIFQADKKHLHHRILAVSGGYKRTLFIIYGVCVLLGFVAAVSLYNGTRYRMVFFAGAFVFVSSLLYLLRIWELRKGFQNGEHTTEKIGEINDAIRSKQRNRADRVAQKKKKK